MSKQQRHERRKTERARRRQANPQSAIRNGATALAAAAAIAAGTSAYAVPIRFDNPTGTGHFDWTTGTAWLDLTLEAGSQGGGAGPTSLLQQQIYGAYVTSLAEYPAEVRREGVILVPFDAGQLIDSGGSWGGYAWADLSAYGYPVLLPEGVPTYLGVRFPDDGTHYAWIGVVFTGSVLDTFAWGYETDAGVPIAAGAPEPGTLALLAFGAAGAASRRRRRASATS